MWGFINIHISFLFIVLFHKSRDNGSKKHPLKSTLNIGWCYSLSSLKLCVVSTNYLKQHSFQKFPIRQILEWKHCMIMDIVFVIYLELFQICFMEFLSIPRQLVRAFNVVAFLLPFPEYLLLCRLHAWNPVI